MKLITQNVEKTLFQTIKRSWENNESQRCLYLRTSQLKTENKEWFLILTQTIEEFLNDETGYIFRCHDNDVFILNRHLTNKNLSTLLRYLDPNLMPESFNKDLASLFEINVSWAQLNKLCNKKIDQINLIKLQEEKLKIKKEEEEYKKKIINTKVDRDIISSLQSRRQKRKTPTILVVEDDIFSQRLVKNAINKDYMVATAKNGYEAITRYAKEAPDILFLDIGLPDISGHDILKKIFDMDSNAYVVMLSGNGDKQNVLKAIEQGAKGFIAKPFTKEKLSQYIQKSPFIQEKQNKEYKNENSIR